MSTCSYTGQELYKRLDLVNMVSNDANTSWNRYSSIITIKTLCKELDIELVIVPESVSHSPYPNGKKLDYARDLEHPGVKVNKIIAEYCIKYLKKIGFTNE